MVFEICHVVDSFNSSSPKVPRSFSLTAELLILVFYRYAFGCFFLPMSLDSVFLFRNYNLFIIVTVIFYYWQDKHVHNLWSWLSEFCSTVYGWGRGRLSHLHLSFTTTIFWSLSALYSSTNAINIFLTLVSKSLMKILNDIEARMDPWETQLNIFCQADVESLILEWKNNSSWLIYWMSLIFSCSSH